MEKRLKFLNGGILKALLEADFGAENLRE